MNYAYFTICSVNYLAYALTLYYSLEKADPEAAKNFKLVLVDREAPSEPLPFEVILSEDLGIEHFWDMAMRYSVMEMNTAVKPAAILNLFDRGFDTAFYIDPDIYVLKPLQHVKDLLQDGASVVLTPHSTEPLEDGLDPDDVRLLRTGSYNLGFGAFANNSEARALVEWWHRRMIGQCVVDLENGLFVDQRFMDLAPSYAPSARILHHKGYNAAYWNLQSREVLKKDDEWTAGGDPLHFFHFSGVVPGNPNVFSKHQNRFTPKNIGELNGLLAEYLEQLEKNKHGEWAANAYSYSTFTDGSKISNIARSVYHKTFEPSVKSEGEAFAPNNDLLDEPVPGSSVLRSLPLTRLMAQIAAERPDLREQFPLNHPIGREAFCRWMLSAVEREYGLPQSAYLSILSSLSSTGENAAPRVSIRHPRRWLAQQALRIVPHVRKLVKMVPLDLRIRIRELVLRSASGHSIAGGPSNGLNKRSLPKTLARGIGVYGYHTAVSGVAEGARRMLSALETQNIPHTAHVVSSSGSAPEIIAAPDSVTNEASPHDILLFHVNADQTPHVFGMLPSDEIRNKYRIGYWAWELSRFPEEWEKSLNYIDEVWVPSNFVREAVRACTDKPVKVIPHPIPERPSSGETRVNFALPENRLLVLSSLDLNSYSSRKNPTGNYEAFCKAFPNKDRNDPLLVMKVHGGLHLGPRRRELIDELTRDPRVILIDMPLDDLRYAALQELCDAFLSLHRSEGFGMNIAECMRLGKPVIATGYSGNLDFMNDENSYLVDHTIIPLREDDYPMWSGQEWADPDIDHAAELLRQIVDNPEEATKRGTNARDTMLSEYSTEVVGKMVDKRISEIIGTENVQAPSTPLVAAKV